LNEDRVSPIREQWKGKSIIKRIVSEEDTVKAINLGADGLIVYNHGGRLLDAGQLSLFL
tara:strand:+ start:313 stop:489 length:177 start_codon:yes stop_codon:yes gene_type:complete